MGASPPINDPNNKSNLTYLKWNPKPEDAQKKLKFAKQISIFLSPSYYNYVNYELQNSKSSEGNSIFSNTEF